jgi:gamma-glutamyltranspeptidase/glutathione hydrolase
VLNVTHGEAASFPGIAPLVIYDAATKTARSYIGAGTAPAAATLERYLSKGYKTVPDLNILSQLVPASPDVIISLLNDYGTMSFGELSAEAIRIARAGFPIHEIMFKNMNFSLLNLIGYQVLFPYNTKVYLGGQFWRPLSYKDRLTLPDLAGSLEAMASAEAAALKAGGDRRAGLQAVRDYFYKGPLAAAIADLHTKKGGLMTAADLAGYAGAWEKPVVGSYGDYEFFANGPWSQGPVGPLALQILEGIDLKNLGHNSPRYIHTVAQAIELAMADREGYMGDPAFVKVPLEEMMSKAYAASRRAQMTARAFGPLPAPGKLGATGYLEPAPLSLPTVSPGPSLPSTPIASTLLSGARIGKDTSQIVIVDRKGNAIAMTPSDFPKSPMVPGTGLTLGDRMTQFRLDPKSPDVIAPGKRPRVSPQALVVLRKGEFFMAYSSPGEDMQTQALVQVFLNMAVFGMGLEEAIEAPRFRDVSMPASFAPHQAYPGTLLLEAALYDKAAAGLAELGYTTKRNPDWDNTFGAVGAVLREGKSLLAGSDPREEGTAAGR